MSSSLSELCFEQVKDNFWLASYGGIKVVMKKNSGWVNATLMCTVHHSWIGGSNFNVWFELETSQDLIKSFARQLRIETDEHVPDDLCERIYKPLGEGWNEHDSKIYGTYVHRSLVWHVASWCNPGFGLKCSGVINSHAIVNFNEKLAKACKKIESLQHDLNETRDALDDALKRHTQREDELDSAEDLIQRLKKRLASVEDAFASANANNKLSHEVWESLMSTFDADADYNEIVNQEL